MLMVARCLRDGVGVPQDLETAAVWYERAAHRGHPQAMHELGELFEDGFKTDRHIIDKDFGMAVRWYKAAARLGLHSAQLNLGKMMLAGAMVDPAMLLECGSTILPSLGELQLKGLYWLREAGRCGSIEARQLLERTQR
jgi:TPR repeat protein